MSTNIENEQEDVAPEDEVEIPPREVERQLQDLNDQVFDQVLLKLGVLLEMFRSDAASEASESAAKAKDIGKLRDYIAKRNMDGYQLTWDLIRFVQNLRQP